jgi:hypothetical protein
MKKKLFAVLATMLAVSTLSLSACTSGNSKITFKNYWNVNTEYTSNETINETLTYDVSYLPSGNGAINYVLDYEGTYTTNLYLKSSADDVYVFTSDLVVDATFMVNGLEEVKHDYVHTEVTFYKAGGTENLRPISSLKQITSHSPIMTTSASTPQDCYYRYDYEIKTVYENGQGVCTRTSKIYNEELNDYIETVDYEKSFTATSKKRTVLDNEQFPIAFRAMPAGTDTTVQMFNPFLQHSQNYRVSLSGDTTERKYEYTLNGSKVTPTLRYHTGTIVVDGTASGQAQWAEIATIEDERMNTDRRIMLAYYAPLAQNVGLMVYELTSATYR